MKPNGGPSGWCTPKDLQKLARVASRVILNRTIPGTRGVLRYRWSTLARGPSGASLRGR